MRSPLTDPASDILKALGINTDFVLRYSLHFSAEEVTTCMVEVVVCKDPMKSMQEQLKRYKVTLEPLEEETKPKVEPELYFLKDGPKAAGPSTAVFVPVLDHRCSPEASVTTKGNIENGN